jgi:hypothetical protein
VHTALDTVPRHVLHDLLVRGITPPLPSPPLLLLLLLLRCLGPTDAALPGTTGSSVKLLSSCRGRCLSRTALHCTALLCAKFRRVGWLWVGAGRMNP